MNTPVMSSLSDRRAFLKNSMAAGIGISVLGISSGGCMDKNLEEKETTPNEDLMREHGLLDRVLIIYEHNLKSGLRPQVVHAAATIIQEFIENYHEKLEEEYLFPVLEKNSAMANLVATLKNQHVVGRKLTSAILSKALNPTPDKVTLEHDISAFISMYRAHASREDTILFPAFKEALSVNRYKELGDIFEEKEHKLFGKDGFEGMLAKVEGLEKEIGIYDLAVFTPSVF